MFCTVDVLLTCEGKLLTNRPDAPAVGRYLVSDTRTCPSGIELIGCSYFVGPTVTCEFEILYVPPVLISSIDDPRNELYGTGIPYTLEISDQPDSPDPK